RGDRQADVLELGRRGDVREHALAGLLAEAAGGRRARRLAEVHLVAAADRAELALDHAARLGAQLLHLARGGDPVRRLVAALDALPRHLGVLALVPAGRVLADADLPHVLVGVGGVPGRRAARGAGRRRRDRQRRAVRRVRPLRDQVDGRGVLVL